MKKGVLYIVLIIPFLCFEVFAQNTLAEKLGYSSDTKLLILHSDDLGVTHSTNLGSILAMKVGMVNSASIMMPTPWVMEVAEYAQKNPQADFGLHLTLTSEWKHLKWRPITGKDKVPSLVDSLGFFHADCMTFGKLAKLEEVEIELRGQIETAIQMGINPTHLDTHMGCLVFNSPELFDLYLKLGREYKIPTMVGRFFYQTASSSFKEKMSPREIVVNRVYTADIPDFETGMADYYEKILRSLSSGISTILIHTAFDDAESQAMSIEHPHWGATWRQEDFDFFTSERCRKILEEENIKFVTWREIQAAKYD